MALILQIRAETKAAQRQIETAAKKAGASVKRLEKTSAASAIKMSGAFGGVGKMLGTLGIGLGIGIALRGIKSIISETITFTDQIGKLSTRLGESTEFLSEMGFVAERSGVTFQAMSVGIQRANRRMAEAREGFGEAKKVLEELDLELNNTDGSARNFEQILPDLADKINGLSSEQDKLRIAFKLFDTEGVSFLQFLKSGSSGIAQLRTEARTLGLSLDKDATNKAAQAADALTDFQGATKGLTTEIVISLLPALSDWTEGMTTLITGFDQARIRARVWAKEQESNTSFLNRQIQALESQASKLKASGAAYIKAGKETEAYKGILDLLVATEGLELGNLESVNRLLAETIRLRKQEKEEGKDAGGLVAALGPTPEQQTAWLKILEARGEIGTREQESLRAQKQITADLSEWADEYGLVTISQKELNESLDLSVTSWDRINASVNNFAMGMAAARQQMGIFFDLANQALDIFEQLQRSTGGFIGSVLGGIGGFIAAGPAGIIPGAQAGGQLAGRLGFQQGGSFMVGGSGGADSQTVAFRASPGERVDVTPRNQATDSISGRPVIINLHFPNANRIDEFLFMSQVGPWINKAIEEGQIKGVVTP